MHAIRFVFIAFVAISLASAAAKEPASHVIFNDEGIALVGGKPFFPVGMFIYELNSGVLAELHELQINTVLHGFYPSSGRGEPSAARFPTVRAQRTRRAAARTAARPGS